MVSTNVMPSDAHQSFPRFAHASSKWVSVFNTKWAQCWSSTLEKQQAEFLVEEGASGLSLTLIDLSFQLPELKEKKIFWPIFYEVVQVVRGLLRLCSEWQAQCPPCERPVPGCCKPASWLVLAVIHRFAAQNGSCVKPSIQGRSAEESVPVCRAARKERCLLDLI